MAFKKTILIGMLAGDKVGITEEGGFFVSLINKTGVNSVKGSVVRISATQNAFELNPTSGTLWFGVVYESGIADGSLCRVVIRGIAEALLEDSTASAAQNVIAPSATTAGRFDCSGAGPGNCLETKSSGTNVLCKVLI